MSSVTPAPISTPLPRRVVFARNTASGAPASSAYISLLEDALVGLLTGERPEMPDLSTSNNSATVDEKRCALAWHSVKALAAIAVEDVLYFFDAQKRVFSAQLNDQRVRHILCLEWLEESDSIVVGFINGVAIWRNINIDPTSGMLTHLEPTILKHPREKPVHEISVCPRGRSFVSMTRGEKKIYLWDSFSATGSCTPIYCLRDTLTRSVRWAPAGSLIMVTDQVGGLSLIDCISWQTDFCDRNLHLDPGLGFENVCWLSDFVCIFNLKETRMVYSCNIMTDDMGTSKIQGQNAFVGMSLPLNFTGRISKHMRDCLMKKKALTTEDDLADSLVVSKMVSYRSRGNFVAVEFQFKQSLVERATRKVHKIPLIALYIPGTAPHLSMTLIKVIEPSINNLDLHNIYPLDFKFKFAKDIALNFGAVSGTHAPSTGVTTSAAGIFSPQQTFLSVVWADRTTGNMLMEVHRV